MTWPGNSWISLVIFSLGDILSVRAISMYVFHFYFCSFIFAVSFPPLGASLLWTVWGHIISQVRHSGVADCMGKQTVLHRGVACCLNGVCFILNWWIRIGTGKHTIIVESGKSLTSIGICGSKNVDNKQHHDYCWTNQWSGHVILHASKHPHHQQPDAPDWQAKGVTTLSFSLYRTMTCFKTRVEWGAN